MKKILTISLILILPLLLTACEITNDSSKNSLEGDDAVVSDKPDTDMPVSEEGDNSPEDESDGSSPSTGLANPASVNCETQGGRVEIRTASDGGQVGYCKFTDGSECEEWALFRKECAQGNSLNLEKVDLVADAALIRQALIDQKKLNLTGMKVVLNKDTGIYAAGSVTPEVTPSGGGGYVFAAKVSGKWMIVADGNGSIMCDYLSPYPGFPVDMISECVNQDGTVTKRQ